MSDTRARFAVGDRVVARPDTTWDDGIDLSDGVVRFHGHYGHVIDGCGRGCTEIYVHVLWEGTYDGRRAPGTIYTDHTAWHMTPDEIEHAD